MLKIIPKKWFSTIRHEISQISTKDAFLQKVECIKQDIGADYITCATCFDFLNKNQDILFLTSDTPISWREEYQEKSYVRNDARIIQARKNNLPFIWQDIEKKIFGGVDILKEAKEYQLNFGITFPVHGPNGQFGFLSLMYKEKPNKMQSRIEHITPYMQIIAMQLVEAQRRFVKFEAIFTEASNSKDDVLTKRQRECLIWAAEGKTTEEISVILDLSDSTVIRHLDHAKNLLHSGNRTQCIAKAIDQKIIALEYKKKQTISYLHK